MAITLKFQKPSLEKKLVFEGYGASITVGIRAYSSKEAKEVQKKLSTYLSSDQIDKQSAELEDFLASGNKLEDSFYVEKADRQEKLSALIEQREQQFESFYKGQVVYLKYATLVIDGKDVSIPDTQVAEKFASLDGSVSWESPAECLVALLDAYFDFPPFKDALISAINNSLYNIVESKQARVKNS